MEQIIWTELMTLKFSERYLALYLDALKRNRKIVNLLLIIFSSAGLIVGSHWQVALWA